MALPQEFDRPVYLDDPEVGNHRDVVTRRLLVSNLHDWLTADNRTGVDLGLSVIDHWSRDLPVVGSGRTLELWSILATLGAHDLQTARTVEPDLDARSILAEADLDLAPSFSSWGVYAAEGPGLRLEASVQSGESDSYHLNGVKPWCSLAARLNSALVTAWQGDERRLFAVDLGHAGAEPGASDGWVARGLPDVHSTSVTFDHVPAQPVGEPGWYLHRSGFAWGGMGVAAVWFGGAVRIVRHLGAALQRRTPDQIAYLHLGACDAALHGARVALLQAVSEIENGSARGAAGAVLAARVRHVVFEAAETILRHADHALGPAPLATDPAYAAHVAGLHLYLRQHHAERDSAALGKQLLDPDRSAT